jgi:CubicO group peptidase (beta-lactamase class C family)
LKRLSNHIIFTSTNQSKSSIMKTLYFYLQFHALLFILPPAKAQTFNPLLASMLQDTLTTYASAFSSIKGMSASVYIPSQGLWQGISGVSYAGHPITQGMEFGIASNSKLFASTAILILQENGILNLNDNLSMWLPSLNPHINPNITIRQLLNHTSGVPELLSYSPWIDTIMANPTRVFTPTEVVNWVNTSLFLPGTSWSYSNTNYVLAGMIVKNATGLNLSKIIRDSILTPLNLNSTFFDVEEPEIGIIAHRWWNGNIITNPLTDYNSVSRVALNTAGGSAGAIFSNSSDMATWYHALFSGQILNPSSMAELTNFITTGSLTQKYGLGLTRETTFGLTYWGHGGDTWGYKSKMMYDTCMGTVVCGLSNSYPNSMTSIPFLLYRVVKNHVPGCLGTITGASTVCQGQNSVTYSVPQIPLASSYEWTLPNGATGSSLTNSITINFGAFSMSGNLYVKGVNAYGTGAISSKAITVNTLPNLNIVASDSTICEGQSLSMTASGASTYTWLPNLSMGNSINVSPISNTTYTVTGTSVNGCTRSLTQTIHVTPCSITLSLKLFIQGYYQGLGTMTSAMNNQNYSPTPLLNDVDDIEVELHFANSPYTICS